MFLKKFLSGIRVPSKVNKNIKLSNDLTGTRSTIIQYLTNNNLLISIAEIILEYAHEKYADYGTRLILHNLCNFITVLSQNFIVSDSNNVLKIWNINSKINNNNNNSDNCIFTLNGHTQRISCIALHPGGNIISGSYDKTVRVWNAVTGQCIKVLTGHSEHISYIGFLSNNRIVSRSDKEIIVWSNISRKNDVFLFDQHGTYTLILPTDRICSVDAYGYAWIWNHTTINYIKHYLASCEYKLHFPPTNLPNNHFVLCNDTGLRLYNAITFDFALLLEDENVASMNIVDCNTDDCNYKIITGSYSGVFNIWDICQRFNILTGYKSYHCNFNVNRFNNSINHIKIISENKIVVVINNTIKIIDLLTYNCDNTLTLTDGYIQHIHTLPNHGIIYIVNNTVGVWE